jgi:hypothetical protein
LLRVRLAFYYFIIIIAATTTAMRRRKREAAAVFYLKITSSDISQFNPSQSFKLDLQQWGSGKRATVYSLHARAVQVTTDE